MWLIKESMHIISVRCWAKFAQLLFKLLNQKSKWSSGILLSEGKPLARECAWVRSQHQEGHPAVKTCHVCIVLLEYVR